MKKKPATNRRRTKPELALKIARAQLRAIAKYGGVFNPIAHPDGSGEAPRSGRSDLPPKFIQITTVTRGYSGVTQALDNAGQVWERVSLMEDVIDEDGKKGKRLKDSWWVPLGMERREA